MSLSVGSRVGPYEILGLEGAGGMGEVYSAHDTKLSRNVALKILPASLAAQPDRVARLAREAHVLATLNHPNIAAIYGIEESAGTHALVLELVEGPTLEDRIARGPIAPEEALAIARQIADALDAAHEHGIVHRDLKPSNIKVRADGTVKVLDFGIAKAVDPTLAGPTHAATLTASLTIVGTPSYMSPEQARGATLDRRTDIWAFGCVLYEMLTAKQAFSGGDSAEIIGSILTKEPDWNALPASLSPTVSVFLRRCLRKDPKQRVRDMGDLHLALDGAFDVLAGVLEDSRASRNVRRTLFGVAGVVIVAVAIGIAARFAASERDDRTMTFVVHPPERTTFGPTTMEPYPVLSPDERYLAFRAPMGAGTVMWVQALGDRQARSLRGTEDGGFPFWSPDSRSLGFFKGGRLMTISAFGDSPPQEVCVCNAAWGGAWNSEGTIVFATTSGGLARVSADGGPATAVVRADASRGEFSYRFPLFLPDGRRFVYLVRSTSQEHRGLYVGSLDDPAMKQRVVADESNAGYGIGPDGRGYLFFVRDLTLLAQPFDETRAQLIGSPTVIARPVIPGQGGRLAPFSVSGRTLVSRTLGRTESRLQWVSRSGAPRGTVGPPSQEYRNPAMSPDGRFVAVEMRDPQTGKQDIWNFDTRRAISERLTTDPVDALHPVWMSDSKRVVFASAREGPWNLYWRWANGRGSEEPLYRAPAPGTKYPRDATHDGRFLLFLGDSETVWALPLDGKTQPHQLLSQATRARVSPDGRWLAYATGRSDSMRYEAGDSEGPRGTASQILVTTFPVPTESFRISSTGGDDPQWRADGRELYYIDDQTLMAVSIQGGTTFAAGTPEPLFRAVFNPQSLSSGSAYAPTADGQRFLVDESTRTDERLLIVTMNWTLENRR